MEDQLTHTENEECRQIQTHKHENKVTKKRRKRDFERQM